MVPRSWRRRAVSAAATGQHLDHHQQSTSVQSLGAFQCCPFETIAPIVLWTQLSRMAWCALFGYRKNVTGVQRRGPHVSFTRCPAREGEKVAERMIYSHRQYEFRGHKRIMHCSRQTPQIHASTILRFYTSTRMTLADPTEFQVYGRDVRYRTTFSGPCSCPGAFSDAGSRVVGQEEQIK